MKNKDKIDLIIKKISEDQKSAFVAELREAESKHDRAKIFEKYGISLTDEEKTLLKENQHEVSDEELDVAAAGCCGQSSCFTCSCD